MKGFASYLTEAMNPNAIRLAGTQLEIDEFRDNPEIWSEKVIAYAFSQIFEKLLIPVPKRDPSGDISRIYSGRSDALLYRIATDHLTGATSPFWKSDSFGKLQITYPTLTYYFGKDFYKIQPALYYAYANVKRPDSVRDLAINHVLTEEFENKIRHLYEDFYTLLSSSYQHNQEIQATFHIEKALGFGEATKISGSLGVTADRFRDLIQGNDLKFVIQKDSNNIMNEAEFRTFVASIVFYLVMFNAYVFIGDEENGYTLFASQRKIYNDEYITGLYSRDTISDVKLNQAGQQIYDTWRERWNMDEGRNVWNFEDCWPIFLLGDARDLIDTFVGLFNTRIEGLT